MYKRQIEKLSEESDDILDREERPVRRRRISEEKPETKRPERRKPERKERQEEDKSSQKHRSFLMNFEDDDDEVYDEEDDFDLSLIHIYLEICTMLRQRCRFQNMHSLANQARNFG